MDSQFDSQYQTIIGLESRAAAPRGRVGAALDAWRRHQRERARRPVRLASLAPWRVAALLVLATLLAITVAGLQVLRSHQRSAADAALADVAFVESRLDQLTKEFDRLEGHLATLADVRGCTAPIAQGLARASLASELVWRFHVGERDAALACFPDGNASAPVPARAPVAQLSVYSTGQIAARVMATRSGAGTRVLGAVLDTRAFDRPAALAPAGARLAAVHTTLLSADGRRLADLDGVRSDAPHTPRLRSVAQSQRFGAKVQADVAWPALVSAAIDRIAIATVVAWLLVLAIVLLAWRHTMQRAQASSRIERGLRKRQFEPHVQPIVDLATGRCAGGEILMRWLHPERGTLAPGEFIAEAERSGLIVAMSDLVMERAAQRLAKLAHEQPELYFSFNITPLQLRQGGFAQRLAELFHAGTIAQSQVLLELTEREFAGRGGARVMTALHTAGWRIAIDDFGTGQSSLAMLEQLPVDRIKIDLSFVRAIGEQTVNRPVLDAIITLAGQLRVPLIAEGVETEAQWDYLARRGVRYAQGYLIARPMPIDVFVRWFAQQQDSASVGNTEAPGTTPTPLSFVDADARQLWQRMGSGGGLDVRDRMHRLRRYPRCFIGREAVDWIARQLGVTRADAVAIGKRLTALGLIEHVLQEHDFADAELYYRLTPGASPGAAAPELGVDLRAALGDAGGVATRSHTRGLVRHRQSALGSEVVDWICRSYSVTRPTARQWGAELMRRGALRHVFDDQPFRDDRTLYRIA